MVNNYMSRWGDEDPGWPPVGEPEAEATSGSLIQVQVDVVKAIHRYTILIEFVYCKVSNIG